MDRIINLDGKEVGMKDIYTQADMDSAIMAYEREKKLREIAVENFEEMKTQVEGIPDKEEKIEEIRKRMIMYTERVKDAVLRPRISYDLSNRAEIIADSFDKFIKELEKLK